MVGDVMSSEETTPGWYPDAVTPGHMRYWDGSRWTHHTVAPRPIAPGGEQPARASQTTPRAPQRRPPLPALFVVGTVLIGIPLAIAIGVIVARASAPLPLAAPAPAHVDQAASAQSPSPIVDAADAAAHADAAAIGQGIKRFYQQTPQGGIAAPVVTVADGAYILGPVNTGTSVWEWPPIAMSEGVSLGGQTGTRQDDWCVWVHADGGTVGAWQVTPEGVTAGHCGQ